MDKELEQLPSGCITRKKINGKEYYYHQWTDSQGKRHYDTVSADEAETLKAQIEKRRALEKELKSDRSSSSSAGRLLSAIDTDMAAVYGYPLLALASVADGLDKRDCYSVVHDYIYGRPQDKVCLLYGLRRTGKTTIIRQLIREMSPKDFAATVYIKAGINDTMADINRTFKEFISHGFRFFFIDEMTLIRDFVDSASLISDVYAAQGLKIVLSGTDSLGFYFASHEELYDRAVMVHTTYIPFREYSRLLGINDIDAYIRYGGTLKAGEVRFGADIGWDEASFRDDESTRRYVDTAICRNIQHSLACYEEGGHFRHLKKLYDAGELTNAINRILQDMNHDFTVDVIEREFISRDLRSTAQMLRKSRNADERTDALDDLDTEAVIEGLKRVLEIREKDELVSEIRPDAVAEIREYLEALDLIEYVDIESSVGSDELAERVIFTQPGMRYCQAQTFVYLLMRDRGFKELSERDKMLIAEKILDDVRGIMLEDIVLLETKKKASPAKRVFKMQFVVGEIDMVVYDTDSNTCELYEVKHSNVCVDEQWKNISDPDKRAIVTRRFGDIVGEHVLYKGETCTSADGRHYINVEQYLKETE